MSNETTTVSIWMLDSSTFIHACMIDRVPLLATVRQPLCFPDYVFRWELGQDRHQDTWLNAEKWTKQGRIFVRQLSLQDLDRMAQLNPPRRISLGEMACAIIAEREGGGVLCDDRRARRWLEARILSQRWEAIEDILLDAAHQGYLGETDLLDCQRILERNQYRCRCEMRLEHVQRLMSGRYQVDNPSTAPS